jgi:hypothetical protein
MEVATQLTGLNSNFEVAKSSRHPTDGHPNSKKGHTRVDHPF